MAALLKTAYGRGGGVVLGRGVGVDLGVAVGSVGSYKACPGRGTK